MRFIAAFLLALVVSVATQLLGHLLDIGPETGWATLGGWWGACAYFGVLRVRA